MTPMLRKVTLVGVIVTLRQVASLFLRGWLLYLVLGILTATVLLGKRWINHHPAAIIGHL